MNIFVLDYEQELCAQYHCDKHVVKMIVEYAQLLSTAHRLLDGEMQVVEYTTKTGKQRKKKVYMLPDVREQILYKATHVNHPSAVWARKSLRNYQWLSCLLGWLCKEYTHRYGKIHKVQASGLMDRLYKHPKHFNKSSALVEMTTIPQAMPEQFQREDAVEAYRAFYNGSKARFAKWKLGNVPEWFKPI